VPLDHPDLGEQGRLGRAAVLAFEHPALHLPTDDAPLDQDLRVHRPGGGDSGLQLGPVVDLRDAVRGAGPGRLDEHRQPEVPLVLLGQRLPGPQRHVRPGGDTLGGGQLLAELLVHRGRRGEHVGAHVRDPGHLQQTLNGAVLAIGPVQHWKRHIDVAERAGSGGRVQDDQAAHRRVAGEHDRGARVGGDLRQAPAGDGQAGRITTGQYPLAGAGDADRDGLELVGVQGGQDAAGADTRDGVLGAAPAENDSDTGLPGAGHPLTLLCAVILRLVGRFGHLSHTNGSRGVPAERERHNLAQ
jgi:hypothetical protein